MNNTTAVLALLVGLGLRLAVPILVTVLVIMALARLDRHWQTEADLMTLAVQKPECWKMRNCSAGSRRDCAGYKSAFPCWQVFRHSNGYLDEKCLGCPVLVAAPVPNRA